MGLNVTGCDLSSPCGRDLIKAMKDVTVAPGPEEVPGWPSPPPQPLSATKVVIVTAEALSQNRRFVFIMHLYYKLPGNGVFR